MHPAVGHLAVMLYILGHLTHEAYQLNQDDEYYQLRELFAVVSDCLQRLLYLTRGF